MMEVMHHHEEEEVVAEPLPTWQPDITAPAGDIITSDMQETDNKNVVYLDKDEGNVLKLDEADIGELVNAAIRSQNTVINVKGNEIVSTEKEENINITSNTISGVMHENVRIINLVEEQSDDDDEEEVIELEFQRAAEKVHTHTPYCPNCSSQITKVILRRTKKERKRPNADKPVDLLGCLSCFSIFIPSGNGLNPFRIFGKKGIKESTPIVEGTHELSGNNNPLADHAQGSENADKNPSIEQAGDAFDLFRIFSKGKGKKNEQHSQGNIHKGESSNEAKNPVHNLNTALPVSSLHVPLLHGNKPSDHPTKDEHNESTINEPQIPGHCSEITPPNASGELAIDITVEIGTGVTGEQAGLVPNTKSSNKSLEILKCIVYGGLMETIASLSVVSSAAASDATTLNIIAIGLATVISGIFLFGNNLIDLKNEDKNVGENSNCQKDKYQELLGTRGHFLLHSTFAVLSFLVFGLIPPIIYGFAFRESDDKNYKILAVASASFTCVIGLAITKAYVQRLTKWSEYVKTVFYYVTMAICVSGVSYAAGNLFKMLMERLGWFEPDQAVTPTDWVSY